jgi:hypothetical protein
MVGSLSGDMLNIGDEGGEVSRSIWTTTVLGQRRLKRCKEFSHGVVCRLLSELPDSTAKLLDGEWKAAGHFSTMTRPAYISFTSLTSCSCEIGRVSGCNSVADSLPPGVNAG